MNKGFCVSYQRKKIFKSLPDTALMYLHILGVFCLFAYGVYYLFFQTFVIGIFLLISACSGFISLIFLALKKRCTYIFPLYAISLGFALFLTSYFHGYKGIIFLFPYIVYLFYLVNFKLALLGSILISTSCLIATLHVTQLATTLSYAIALLISIGFSACYAYVMNKQRKTLEKNAHYDDLTGITNRRYFTYWLYSLFNENYKPFKNITLFHLDIDDFKNINDTYGHTAGDELLKLFSERTLNLVRQDDLITESKAIYNFARLAGDEFVLAIIDLDCSDTAKKIAKRLLKNTALTFYLSSGKININLSIGVVFSKDKIAVDELLHNANIAMYRAKKSGKNTFYLYDDSLSSEIVRRKDIEENIAKALHNESFELVYMPIYNLENLEKIAGFEALLRIDENYLHVSELEKIIFVAEASGLIKDIDCWVVENTFKQLKTIESDSELHDAWCAINISSAELLDSKFIEKVKLLVAAYEVDPSKIHFEITETKLVPYEDIVIKRLKLLKKMGFHLALDDYGTGYTGFAQLLNFPGNFIKIDRSFIAEIGHHDKKYNKIIEIIMSIAKTCTLQVVAEGVETEEQLAYLKSIGCQYVQGYYFSKPLSWQQLIHFKKADPVA